MDAVEFIKERDRMCRFYHHAGDCYQCPAKDCECSVLEGMVDDDNIVTIVEEWSAAHPIKTRQSEFLKHYPDARILAHGCLNACPMNVFSDTGINCNAQPCFECKKDFWLAEVENAEAK